MRKPLIGVGSFVHRLALIPQTISPHPQYPPHSDLPPLRLKTPAYFQQRYGVDLVYYTDEIVTILKQQRPSALLVMQGTNSDSKSNFQQPNFEGIEQ